MGDAVSLKSTWVAFLGLLLTAAVTVGALVYNYSTAYAALDTKVKQLEKQSDLRTARIDEMTRTISTICTDMAVVKRDMSYTVDALGDIKESLKQIRASEAKEKKANGN